MRRLRRREGEERKGRVGDRWEWEEREGGGGGGDSGAGEGLTAVEGYLTVERENMVVGTIRRGKDAENEFSGIEKQKRKLVVE